MLKKEANVGVQENLGGCIGDRVAGGVVQDGYDNCDEVPIPHDGASDLLSENERQDLEQEAHNVEGSGYYSTVSHPTSEREAQQGQERHIDPTGHKLSDTESTIPNDSFVAGYLLEAAEAIHEDMGDDEPEATKTKKDGCGDAVTAQTVHASNTPPTVDGIGAYVPQSSGSDEVRSSCGGKRPRDLPVSYNTSAHKYQNIIDVLEHDHGPVQSTPQGMSPDPRNIPPYQQRDAAQPRNVHRERLNETVEYQDQQGADYTPGQQGYGPVESAERWKGRRSSVGAPDGPPSASACGHAVGGGEPRKRCADDIGAPLHIARQEAPSPGAAFTVQYQTPARRDGLGYEESAVLTPPPVPAPQRSAPIRSASERQGEAQVECGAHQRSSDLAAQTAYSDEMAARRAGGERQRAEERLETGEMPTQPQEAATVPVVHPPARGPMVAPGEPRAGVSLPASGEGRDGTQALAPPLLPERFEQGLIEGGRAMGQCETETRYRAELLEHRFHRDKELQNSREAGQKAGHEVQLLEAQAEHEAQRRLDLEREAKEVLAAERRRADDKERECELRCRNLMSEGERVQADKLMKAEQACQQGMEQTKSYKQKF